MTSKTVTGRGLLFLLGLALTLPVSMLAQKSETRPVRVYVFTAAPEGGFVDERSKQRADSLKDFREALSKKKKVATLVEDQSLAEITLEVVNRDRVLTGNTSSRVDPVLGGSVKTTADRAETVRVALAVGDYSTEVIGTCPQGQVVRCWRAAANDAASKVEDWIKDNAARIPRK
ncbi:MAG TPA: hypothetical protein VF447_07210 [Terriglobales bacterium]